MQLVPRHGRAVRRGAGVQRRLGAAGGVVEGRLPPGLEGQLGGQLLLGLVLDLLAESADGLEIEGERLFASDVVSGPGSRRTRGRGPGSAAGPAWVIGACPCD